MSYMYQIAFGPMDPIWMVHAVWGQNCHEIIICHRDALDCGIKAPQMWPYKRFFILQQGLYELCVPNIP